MFPVSFFFFILKIIYKLYWNMAFERLTKFVLLYFIYVVYFWRTVIQPIFTYVKEKLCNEKAETGQKGMGNISVSHASYKAFCFNLLSSKTFTR